MTKQDSDNTTHFGYQTVASEEKADLVRGVFDSVATRYDIMNDLMSAGLHRLWKRYTIDQSGVRAGDVVLDLAGGTGDLALAMWKKVGADGHVVLADINAAMLRQGRTRLVDAGVAGNLSIAQVDARVDETAAALPEHRGVDIGEHDAALGTDLLRECAREVAGTAGKIEHNVAGSHAGLVDRVTLPEPMQTGRHQVVHDVVAGRDGVEDTANLVRLFLGRDGLVPEVRRVVGILLGHCYCSLPAGEDTGKTEN